MATSHTDDHTTRSPSGVEATLAPKDAPAPFNKLGANIILRTIDFVDFRVREGILVEASSFFDDMFSLPPLPEGSGRKRKGRDDQEYRDDVPVIPVTETSRTLNNLLRFCYPVENPRLASADEICESLEASKKYLMEQAERDIKLQFADHVIREPLKLYVLSARRTWKDEMKVAAKGCLAVPFPIGTWIPEMEFMGAGPYMRLQAYHKACSDAAAAVVLREKRISSTMVEYQCSSVTEQQVWFTCNHHNGASLTETFYLPSHPHGLRAWRLVVDYLQALQAEVRVRPRGWTVLNSIKTTEYISLGTQRCKQSQCTSRIAPDLHALCKSLADAVEDAITVQLELKG
ncbi:hypothetical protein BXZ70DRAFT_389895 [Cristinia sonorae]|uniref:BTB domain-containing protein n=1 Tax=Cristinia sonorae TaxID=1940300 RepID=A0A8K0XMF6_9AGAR|nr:hypothetical protein BXZ70DRAFT_389895 [Cristinia sonorae]